MKNRAAAISHPKGAGRRAGNMGQLHWGRRAYAVLLLWAASAIPSQGQKFNTLVNFDGTNGDNPVYVGLAQGLNGNIYGTTEFGGANDLGTVFKLTPGGTLTTLYSFAGPDGLGPGDGLALGADGNFCGTTGGGGTYSWGTIFKITPSGALITLHNFDSTDGAQPYAALVQGTDGDFYGTTYEGGANGFGTVFKISPGGTLTTLHSFDLTEGHLPYGALLQGTDGNFYGTTLEGGAYVYGTVFKITPSGTLTTFHSFDLTDGAYPQAGLIQATDGNFYGTTTEGGTKGGPNGDGTVFKITPGGLLTTLYSFDGTDGYYPTAPLVQATDGNFYGTTAAYSAYGTIFRITPSGTLTVLHTFTGAGGANPYGGLLQYTGGSFYGATFAGGTDNIGTVFSLSVGLGPFVETLPTSGKIGAAVMILGNNLTGATSVTFNGTAGVFRVVSSSEISTTVPTGATTGEVKVVTPSGTLSSNVNFRVTP